MEWPTWVRTDPYMRANRFMMEEHEEGEEEEEEERGDHRKDMYTLSRVHLPPEWEKCPFQLVAVGGDVIAMVLEEERRWSVGVFKLAEEDYRNAVQTLLTRERAKGTENDAYKIFIDPTGQHIIVALNNGENYYCNTTVVGSKKEEAIRIEWLDSRIAAVGWDKANKKHASTGQILLGDDKGLLYLARLERGKGCRTHRLVHELPERQCITGLEVEWFATASKRLLVLVSTSQRLYEFVGGPSLEDVFSDSTGRSAPNSVRLPTPPHTAAPSSGMVIFREKQEGEIGPAKAMAWYSWSSIYHARLNLSDALPAGESVLINGSVMSMMTAETKARAESRISSTHSSGLVHRPSFFTTSHTLHSGSTTQGDPIRSFLIEEQYFLLLYPDRFQVVAQPPGLKWRSKEFPFEQLKVPEIQKRTVWKHSFPYGRQGEGHAVGLLHDLLTGKVYIFTQRAFMELERSEVANKMSTWRSFLQRAMDTQEEDRQEYFRMALRFCETDQQRDEVRIAAADYYFETGDYPKAARVYAVTNKSFEETVVRFINCGKREVLLQYLCLRFNFMKERVMQMYQEASQLVCICTWICQLYLDAISDYGTKDTEQQDQLRTEFHTFVQENLEHVNATVISGMIKKHANQEEVLFFAQLQKDYPTIVTYHMNNENYDLALRCLTAHCTHKFFQDIWYQYSPKLMRHDPLGLVDAWVMDKVACFLDPLMLIPALLHYHPRRNIPGVNEHQGIRYLLWLVREKHRTDAVIHNLIIFFYVKHVPEEDPLVAFLEDVTESVYYDEKYALRLCQEAGKHRACVHVYAALEMYDEGVTVALEKCNDIKLAEHLANVPEDTDVRKKLWLKIVEHVMRGEEGVHSVISLLRDCNSVTFEDVLPFFRDNVPIREFHQDMLEHLSRMIEDIEDLKWKMHEKTEDAKRIAEDTKAVRFRYQEIIAGQQCSICSEQLLSFGSFYVFDLCSHAFHEVCLRDHVKQYMDPEKRSRVEMLHSQLEASKLSVAQGRGEQESDLQAKRELDEILGEECPFCGEYQITEVALDFPLDDPGWDVGDETKQPFDLDEAGWNED